MLLFSISKHIVYFSISFSIFSQHPKLARSIFDFYLNKHYFVDINVLFVYPLNKKVID